jgi:O-antigen biosynthesis protein
MAIPKIAVVGHFFYMEQTEAILGMLERLSLGFDLYASVPADKSEWVKQLLEKTFPDKKITLQVVSNRGFDIAPFVCTFKDVYPLYDLVLKLHTKKSPHRLWLKGWGEYLVSNLAGSPEIVASILQMFEEDKTLGLVYPEPIAPLKAGLEDPLPADWNSCVALAARLRLPLPEKNRLQFPAGSMFWFRPKALAPLFELGLTFEDFPEGRAIRRNGTLAHAIERLLVLVAQKQGNSSRAVCFEPFRMRSKHSFLQNIRDMIHCEWSRLLDFLGIHG